MWLEEEHEVEVGKMSNINTTWLDVTGESFYVQLKSLASGGGGSYIHIYI